MPEQGEAGQVGAERTWSTPTASLVGSSFGVGRPVLLLHAGGERRQVWFSVVAELRRCRPGLDRYVALDQRGHGASAGSATGILELAADVSSVVADLVTAPAADPSSGRGGCVAVGASLGGFAIMAALADPSTAASVEAVVLVDVVPEPDPARVRRFLAARGMLPPDGGLVDDILGRGPELTETLARWGGPATLVRAGRSPIGAHDLARLRAAVPWLEEAEVADADHLVARSAPRALARVIASVLDGLPVGPSARRGGGPYRRT